MALAILSADIRKMIAAIGGWPSAMVDSRYTGWAQNAETLSSAPAS